MVLFFSGDINQTEARADLDAALAILEESIAEVQNSIWN